MGQRRQGARRLGARRTARARGMAASTFQPRTFVASCVADMALREPPKVPKAVRLAATIKVEADMTGCVVGQEVGVV